MRRRLIIMRHAKSDWGAGATSDHDRPLNARGRQDAPRIAARLASMGWRPQVVLSSDSTRTRETYARMADPFANDLGQPESDLAVHFLESLYHAGPRELASALQSVPDDVTTVLALGHNPGWSAVVEWLTDESISLTTANAACCSVEASSWPEATDLAGVWKLEELLRPKEL